VCILLADDCEIACILIAYFVVTLHNNDVLVNAKFSAVNIPYVNLMLYMIFVYWRYNPLWVCILQLSSGAIASSRTRFLDHTQRRAIFGRTHLDEWSVRRRDLYLTTHNTHNRQTSMPPGGIQTHDRSRRAAVDLRLRPRSHWDRLYISYTYLFIYSMEQSPSWEANWFCS